MIITEAGIVIGLVAGAYGIKVLLKKMEYKIDKGRLKKLLIKGFMLMDTDLLEKVILSIKDFDKKNNTQKLQKYLMEIYKIFRDDNDKHTLNRRGMVDLADTLDFVALFEQDEEDEENDKDEIEEKLQESKDVLNEVERRRKEILVRKNMIRARQQGKASKEKRRSFGGMG
jgi:hypothetical protein